MVQKVLAQIFYGDDGGGFLKDEWCKRRGDFFINILYFFFLLLLSLFFIYKLYMQFDLKLIKNGQFFYYYYFCFGYFIFPYIKELDIYTSYINFPKKKKRLYPSILDIVNTFFGPHICGE